MTVKYLTITIALLLMNLVEVATCNVPNSLTFIMLVQASSHSYNIRLDLQYYQVDGISLCNHYFYYH